MLKKYPSTIQFFTDLLSDAGMRWLFFALALGLFTRAYFLSQPMRGDEAYTFLTYVNSGPRALFDYSAPNNHVLNTLLIKLTTLLFDGSPAMIRLPAFLAGLAAIILVFYLSRQLIKDHGAGIFAAVVAALFPYLILYSTNARGYTLVVMFTLLITWIGLRLSSSLSKWGVFWLALFSALGMFSIPIMLFPIAGIFVWLLVLLLLRRIPLKVMLLRLVLPFGLLTGIFTAVFYLPVVIVSGGLAPIISNKFVKPQSFDVFFAGLLPQLQKTFEELSRDIPPAVLLFISVLVVVGFVSAVKTRNWALLLLLPCLLFGAASILLVQHTIPYARTWIYLIPFVLLLADAGLTFVLKHLSPRFQAAVPAAIVLIGFFFAINLTSNDIIIGYGDTSSFTEAPIAAKYLKPIFKPGDTLRISPTADLSVYFYFWYDGMSSVLYDPAPSTGRVFFIRKKSRGPMTDAAIQKYTLLLDMGNMVIYQGTK